MILASSNVAYNTFGPLKYTV